MKSLVVGNCALALCIFVSQSYSKLVSATLAPHDLHTSTNLSKSRKILIGTACVRTGIAPALMEAIIAKIRSIEGGYAMITVFPTSPKSLAMYFASFNVLR